MNTILTILLLIALFIAIICDFIRIRQYRHIAKEEVRKCILKKLDEAYSDWVDDTDFVGGIVEYINKNFDKYFL